MTGTMHRQTVTVIESFRVSGLGILVFLQTESEGLANGTLLASPKNNRSWVVKNRAIAFPSIEKPFDNETVSHQYARFSTAEDRIRAEHQAVERLENRIYQYQLEGIDKPERGEVLECVNLIASNSNIILEHLTENDAAFFYELYSHPQLAVNFDQSPFLPGESPLAFTRRISSLCVFIFTIRLTENPHVPIGDCALHHWDKQRQEISIGGSLLPEYWGQGYMQAALEVLEQIARELGVKTLVGHTQTENKRATRLVEKMGFVITQADDRETVLKKEML